MVLRTGPRSAANAVAKLNFTSSSEKSITQPMTAAALFRPDATGSAGLPDDRRAVARRAGTLTSATAPEGALPTPLSALLQLSQRQTGAVRTATLPI